MQHFLKYRFLLISDKFFFVLIKISLITINGLLDENMVEKNSIPIFFSLHMKVKFFSHSIFFSFQNDHLIEQTYFLNDSEVFIIEGYGYLEHYQFSQSYPISMTMQICVKKWWSNVPQPKAPTVLDGSIVLKPIKNLPYNGIIYHVYNIYIFFTVQ
jgi:hypothetical protein